jgi:hypothetical protein
VIRANAWAIQGRWAEADAAVAEGLRQYAEPSADRDRLLLLRAQTLILRGQLQEAREIVANGMSTLSLYPSSISAVYHLFALSGDAAAAEAYLGDVVTRLEAAAAAASSAAPPLPGPALLASLGHLARLLRGRGLCAEAAGVYLTALSSCELDSAQRLVASAQLVECLSHTTEGAAKYMQRLPEVLSYVVMCCAVLCCINHLT